VRRLDHEGIRAAVASYAAGFDPGLVSAADAQKVLDDAIAIENMAATIKALAAKRVAETALWRRDGDVSAAHHLARRSGTSVSRARQALDTAERLSELAQLDASARAGAVSPAQAAPIADAAAKDPGAERRLLRKAQRSSLGELLDECARTKAAAEPDPEARHRAIHASRYLRRRRAADGAGELSYRSTAEEVAEIFSVVQGYAQRVFERARAEGRREPEEAYLADGLLAAVRAGAGAGRAGAARNGGGDEAHGNDGDGTGAGDHGTGTVDVGAAGEEGHAGEQGNAAERGHAGERPHTGERDDAGERDHAGERPNTGERDHAAERGHSRERPNAGDVLPAPVRPAKVVVRIDWDALVRGWPAGGEVCEIAGVGPVPVSAVRAMVASGDAFLAAVVTKGTDVVNVAHLGRRPSAAQCSGLDWLSPTCSVSGCNASVRLEADHRKDWADTRITLLALLDRLCRHHHRLKTTKGWALVTGTGKRLMVAPDDPRHPGRARAGPVRPA
jgi:hypothetical protein